MRILFWTLLLNLTAYSALSDPIIGTSVTYQCKGAGFETTQQKTITSIDQASDTYKINIIDKSNGILSSRVITEYITTYNEMQDYVSNLSQRCGDSSSTGANIETLNTLVGVLTTCHAKDETEELWAASIPFGVAQLKMSNGICKVIAYK